MGRPYATELAELDETYDWSISASVEQLAGSILGSAAGTMIAVGSGGSLTSAQFASFLHTLFTGHASQVFTPYELIASPQSLIRTSVLISSAGGSNPDVLSCVEHVADRYPNRLFAITTRTNSKLEKLFASRSWPRCHAFRTPVRKDGFLATNSLLATMILLVRAYEKAFRLHDSSPATLDELIHSGMRRDQFIEQLQVNADSVLNRPTVIILHGGSTKPAAADFESRFTEAALSNIQLADFRNFAHGRHHWIARHGSTCSVIAFSSPDDSDAATRTLKLIPDEIPKLNISVQGGVWGAVNAVCHSIFLAHIAGMQKKMDPGRPHVPTFGRKLYHLKASPSPIPSTVKVARRSIMAIERKSGLSIASIVQRGEFDEWLAHYQSFLQRLNGASFRAIVFDYDGTLCGPENRLEGPSDAMLQKLKGLISAGILIGIATGRGKSVRECMRKQLRSSKQRQNVIVGYHNGSEIGSLEDVSYPPADPPLKSSLKPVVKELRGSRVISSISEFQAKGSQITLELHDCLDHSALYEEVTGILNRIGASGVTVVTSTHSIDVLAPNVSKLALLKHIESLGIAQQSILCIGDRGKWPGNDAKMLSHAFSLSVDEVSSDPATCWNLSAGDQRFDMSTLELLDMLSVKNGIAFFDTRRVEP